MRKRHALAIGILATGAAAAVLVPPEPTLAALNDVVTVEVGVSGWRPVPPATSTAGPVTAPAEDPFSPLEPALVVDSSDEQAVPSPTPGPAPDEQQVDPQQGTRPTDPPTASPGSEPTVAPRSDTTASPAEEAPSATGTEGAGTSDGATSASPDPTSEG